MKYKLLILLCVTLAFGCRRGGEEAGDIEETAQQVGDVMASIDEASDGSGNIANLEHSVQRTFARYAPNDVPDRAVIAAVLIPEAQAAGCFSGGTSVSGCSSNIITRTFNNCNIGSASLSGDVTLTWGGGATNCQISAAGHQVSRNPNFTLTGRRGATLAVKKTGANGQTISYVSGTSTNRVFQFTNDGIQRKFTVGSTVLLDNTTTTGSAITITGSNRANRVLTGGSLRVTNNLTSVTCDYIPQNVTWSSGTNSCNCPTQGSWTGSCSDGKSATLNITGCGTATYSQGETSTAVTFDRCTNI
jgi:hypothetical protein